MRPPWVGDASVFRHFGQTFLLPDEKVVDIPEREIILWSKSLTRSGLPGALRSAGALDLARLDAAGAGVEALRAAVDQGPHLLDVGVPAASGPDMRVGDAHPE